MSKSEAAPASKLDKIAAKVAVVEAARAVLAEALALGEIRAIDFGGVGAKVKALGAAIKSAESVFE